jgi:ribosome-associated protein
VENSSSQTNAQEVAHTGDYITLGQFLKFVHIIDEGGLAKWYLSTHSTMVNGQPENRRGRKLRAGDVVVLDDKRSYRLIVKQ